MGKNINEAESFGAFRRVVVTSPKIKEIASDLKDRVLNPVNMRDKFPDVKFKIKKGLLANTLVYDLDGHSSTAIANKIKDAALKYDKNAKVKIKNERPLEKVAEEGGNTSSATPGYLTPNAFRKDKDADGAENTKSMDKLGFKRAPSKHTVFKLVNENYGTDKENLKQLYTWLSSSNSKKVKAAKAIIKDFTEEFPGVQFGKLQSGDLMRLKDNEEMSDFLDSAIEDARDEIGGGSRNFESISATNTLLNELSYKEYKGDTSLSSKQKLNYAIQECNKALFEIERYLKQNKKLQEEDGIKSEQLWKPTAYRLVKMNERVKAISKQIKKLGLSEIMERIEKYEAAKKLKESGKTKLKEATPPKDIKTTIDKILAYKPKDREDMEYVYQCQDLIKLYRSKLEKNPDYLDTIYKNNNMCFDYTEDSKFLDLLNKLGCTKLDF